MTSGLSAPRKLQKSDDSSSFNSGAPELDTWLRQYAFENLRANNAVTYVSMTGAKVAGYYSIAVAGVEKTNVPSALKKGSVPSPVPCILLARLAVDNSCQGRGLGAALFKDALQRTAAVSETVGARALLIHSRDEAARSFYENLSECHRSPISELQLMIPMKYIRAAFLLR